MTWSAQAKASARGCASVATIVTPRAAETARRRRSSASAPVASRPLVGSSSSSVSGAATSSTPMLARLTWPPEMLAAPPPVPSPAPPTTTSAHPSRPSARSAAPTAASVASAALLTALSCGSRVSALKRSSSRGVSARSSRSCCGTSAAAARSGAPSGTGAPPDVRTSSVPPAARQPVGSTSRSAASKRLLPHPEGPRMTVTRPAGTCRVASNSSARPELALAASAPLPAGPESAR